MNKYHRAKLYSVYLRPWTLSRKLATSSVPFAGDLGLGCKGEIGTVRTVWKAYTQEVLPHAVRNIRNFMLNSLAEGRNDEDDDETGKGTSMTCVLKMADVDTS